MHRRGIVLCQTLSRRDFGARFAAAKAFVCQERQFRVIFSRNSQEAERIIAFNEAVRQPFRIVEEKGEIGHASTLSPRDCRRNSLALATPLQ